MKVATVAAKYINRLTPSAILVLENCPGIQ